MSFPGQRVNVYIVLLDVAKFILWGGTIFYYHGAIYECVFSTAPTTDVKVLEFCQSDRWEIVQCVFNWHFSCHE